MSNKKQTSVSSSLPRSNILGMAFLSHWRAFARDRRAISVTIGIVLLCAIGTAYGYGHALHSQPKTSATKVIKPLIVTTQTRHNSTVSTTLGPSSTNSAFPNKTAHISAAATSETTVTSTKSTTVKASSNPLITVKSPLLGAIAATENYSSLSNDGFREVVIAASWSEIEPSNGSYSTNAISALQSQINSANNAGLLVSLDIGTQYAPSWVFSLPGGTSFKDQDSDSFGGNAGSGNDVANAMTDTAVRSVMGAYLSYLGNHLSGIASVRLGGGPGNELRFPSGTAGSRGNAFWFYDSSSQAELPTDAQGWVPGTGTVAQATEFLTAYNNAEVNYGTWLIQQGLDDFASNVKLELLLPGWGERPGETVAAENSLLANTPDEINQGLDWTDLLSALSGNARVVAYTTWADSMNGDGNNPDPAAYIHSILPADMLAGGESTGNGNTTTAGINQMFENAKNWNWYIVNFFFNGQTQSPSQVDAAFNTV
jgi:hypothetical protein